MDKILTISIASYNVEKYIKETLDSLVNSPAIDALEVLVVNDGSKDKTVEIVRGYEKEFPNSIRLIDKQNGGWGSTINASLKEATGKYYKLLDGDDWFKTENIEEYINILKDAQTDIVLTQYTKVFEPNMDRELVECDLPTEKEISVRDLESLAMHALAIKTECIKDKIFITEKCFYTDVEFVIKCAGQANSVAYYPISIYEYRLGVGGQSVSPASYGKNFLQHQTVLKTILPIVFDSNKLSNFEDFLKNLASDHYAICLYASINRTNYKKLKDFSKYLKHNFNDVYKSISKIKRIASKNYLVYLLSAKKLHKQHGIVN